MLPRGLHAQAAQHQIDREFRHKACQLHYAFWLWSCFWCPSWYLTCEGAGLASKRIFWSWWRLSTTTGLSWTSRRNRVRCCPRVNVLQLGPISQPQAPRQPSSQQANHRDNSELEGLRRQKEAWASSDKSGEKADTDGDRFLHIKA